MSHQVKWLGGNSVIVVDEKTPQQMTITLKDQLIDKSIAGALDALERLGSKACAVQEKRVTVGTTGRIQVGHTGKTASASDLRQHLIAAEGVAEEFLKTTPLAVEKAAYEKQRKADAAKAEKVAAVAK